MELSSYIAFSLVALGFAFKPGPGAFIHIARAISDGRRAAIVMALGTDTGHVIAFLAVWFGIGTLTASAPWVSTLLMTLAGLYLGYVGLQGIRKNVVSPDPSRENSSRPYKKLFASGLLWAFINPVNIAFYIGILPSYFDLSKIAGVDLLILLATIFVATFSAHLVYISFSDGFRTMVNDPKKRARIAIVGNSVFILISAFVLWSALSKI